jgi:hypothetical protein
MRLPKLVLDSMRGAAGAALALAIGCGTDAAPPITPEAPPAVIVAPAPVIPAPMPIPPPVPPATLTPTPPAADPEPPPQAEPGAEPDGDPPEGEEALAGTEVDPNSPLRNGLGTIGHGSAGHRHIGIGCGRG